MNSLLARVLELCKKKIVVISFRIERYPVACDPSLYIHRNGIRMKLLCNGCWA